MAEWQPYTSASPAGDGPRSTQPLPLAGDSGAGAAQLLTQGAPAYPAEAESAAAAAITAAPRSHLEQVLTAQYPVVYRMAYALSGREQIGAAIVQTIMRQSLRIFDSWGREGPPPRWFEHHTILTLRRARPAGPDIGSDTLVRNLGIISPQYIAFIRALRGLPQQQREAFILHYAGGFDVRRLAIAMDCSVDAAAIHLGSAMDAMRALAGVSFSSSAAMMSQAYQRLLPTQQLYLPDLRKRLRRQILRRRIWRTIAWLVLLALLGAAGYYGWRIYPLLDY